MAIEKLRNIRFFEHLTPEEQRGLSPLLEVRHYRKGELLFRMGQPADRLYFLQEGTVKVSALSPTGAERILDIFKPGDTFGEQIFSADKRRVGAAQALSHVTAQTVTEEGFRRLMQMHPGICPNFVRHLVGRQRRILMRLEALLHTQVSTRLLAILLDLGQRCAQLVDDSYNLPGEVSQADLARMSGLNRSTVSLVINDYRRRGVLAGKGRRIVIHRTPALALLKSAGLALLD